MIVSIVTLGCKVNWYESDSIALALEKKGIEVVFGIQYADVFVLNSCAVTNEGERKSRNEITKMLKVNPNAKVYVCGCSAQFHPEDYAKMPNVRFVTGTVKKLKLVDAIMGDLKGLELTEFPGKFEEGLKSRQTRTRAVIKIHDGCNSFCSYCIIPYLRGRSRSRTIANIKKELDTVKSREVVFAGVDMAAYGRDLPEAPKLSDVIELMRGRPQRFRFSSLEMGSVTKDLLDKLVTLDNFCSHFHLSMQSGSNTVLKRMNRKHTKESYLDCVKQIRKAYPNCSITTDIIVGFPLETDEEAQETLETTKKAAFASAHIFPYSRRTGTVAARLPDLNGTIKKQRVKELSALVEKMSIAFLKKQIGKVEELLIEEKQGEFYVGYTRNYIRTYVECKSFECECCGQKRKGSADEKVVGTCVAVRFVEPFKDGMKAEPVD